jgi:hypothetical protein
METMREHRRVTRSPRLDDPGAAEAARPDPEQAAPEGRTNRQ